MADINLDDLEAILYQEDSIISKEDVPLLMKLLYESVKHPVPPAIMAELEEQRQRNIDLDR